MSADELIARLEAATDATQDAVVRKALRFAVAHGWITVEACERAMRMCDAGGYESAALTLVPEGMTFCLWQDHRGNCAQVRRPSALSRGVVEPITKGAPTPAIALYIAALRARATEAQP